MDEMGCDMGCNARKSWKYQNDKEMIPARGPQTGFDVALVASEAARKQFLGAFLGWDIGTWA